MSPLRPWLIALVAVLLAATAWAQSSMTPDQAYVRAVSFMQGELNRIEADNRIRHAKATGERVQLKAQLDAAMRELAALKAEAGKNKAAAVALAAFADNNAAGGLDALEAEAQKKSRAALADWKRIGALAFASDTRRAIRAYQEAQKLAPEDVEIQSRLAWLFTRIGAFGEARDIAYKMMDATDPAVRARGFFDAGRIALAQDNAMQANALFRQGLEPARAAKSQRLEAEGLSGLAAAAQAQGLWGQSEALQRQALALYAALKDDTGRAEGLVRLAAAQRLIGSWGQAEMALREAAQIYEAQNDAAGLAAVNLGLGEAAMIRGSPIEATMRFQSAQQGFRMLDDRAGQADAAKGLGDAADKRGSAREACMNWQFARALYAQSGAFVGAPSQAVDKNLREKCR